MDWTSQDARKIAPITSDSDHENAVVRTPPLAAQDGESSSAYWPTRWSLSLSSPASSSPLDSGDPFCRKNTVATMYSRNWRYSLCQFSMTSTAKSADVRYFANEIWPRLSANWSLLNWCQPATACPTSAAMKMAPKKGLSEESLTNLRIPLLRCASPR